MKFNFLKRKDGKCRWWNHKYTFESREEIKLGTGKYIGDKEIKQKAFYIKYKCKKCNDIYISDIIRIN